MKRAALLLTDIFLCPNKIGCLLLFRKGWSFLSLLNANGLSSLKILFKQSLLPWVCVCNTHRMSQRTAYHSIPPCVSMAHTFFLLFFSNVSKPWKGAYGQTFNKPLFSVLWLYINHRTRWPEFLWTRLGLAQFSIHTIICKYFATVSVNLSNSRKFCSRPHEFLSS